jgi:peptidyl-prolyl cis-trans isomerase B (cyclophilin B)
MIPVFVDGGVSSFGTPRTNVLAILSLVFSIGGSILGVVFGHIALGQIARSGERGHGLAIAGLITGYAGIVLIIVLFAIGAAAANA